MSKPQESAPTEKASVSPQPQPQPVAKTPTRARQSPPAGPAPTLTTPGVNLPPCQRDQMLDPATCELMPGHQHAASNVDELAESIAIVGQIHSGQVIELPDGRRWIAAGRRRWMACQKRSFLYRADIWQCASEDAARGEDLARILRIVENEQRVDPSAYDLAVQLRRIRNEHAHQNAQATAAHVGMSVSRVKTYLSVFGASDRLLTAIERERLPIMTAVELVRCEKQFGDAATRKLIAKVVAGEMGASDLQRRREQARHGKRDAKKRDASRQWQTLVTRMRTLFATDPAAGKAGVDALAAAAKELVGAK